MMHNTAGGVEAGGQVIQETTGCAGEQRHVPEDWLVEGASPQASQEDRSLRTSGSPKFHVPSQSGPRGALCGHMAGRLAFPPSGHSSAWPSPSPAGRTMVGDPFPGQASTQSAWGLLLSTRRSLSWGQCWGSWTV